MFMQMKATPVLLCMINNSSCLLSANYAPGTVGEGILYASSPLRPPAMRKVNYRQVEQTASGRSYTVTLIQVQLGILPP